MRVLFVVHCD